MKNKDEIYGAVFARGYTDGWNLHQFAARQIAKLQEELAEAAAQSTLDEGNRGLLSNEIQRAGIMARQSFDRRGDWHTAEVLDCEAMAGELADMYVVMCCLVRTLETIEGHVINIPAIALEKASKDIKRGIR